MDRYTSQQWGAYRSLHARWLEEDDERKVSVEPDFSDWEEEVEDEKDDE